MTQTVAHNVLSHLFLYFLFATIAYDLVEIRKCNFILTKWGGGE